MSSSVTISDHALAFFANRLAWLLDQAEQIPQLTEYQWKAGRLSVDIDGELTEIEDHDLTDDVVLALASNVAVYSAMVFSKEHPDLSVIVPPDWRVTFIRPPSIKRPAMYMRKLRRHVIPLDRYVSDGTMTSGQRMQLEGLVAERKTILISGETGSGKTTLLRALLALVDPGEHIVTIEDPCELMLVDEEGERRAEWTDLEASRVRDMADLLRLALRCRPDRIIVGEVRGPEALELVTACHTGHTGGIFTIHSNGREDALDRLHTAAVRGQPTFPRQMSDNAIDVVVQIVGKGPSRRIREIWMNPKLYNVAPQSPLADIEDGRF